MVETIADNPPPLAPEVSGHRHPRSALRGRLSLLVIAALAGGFCVGRMDTGHMAGLCLATMGLMVVCLGTIGLAWSRIARPIHRFADQLDCLAQHQRETQLRELPTDREDEIGRMAAAVRQLVIHRIRDHHDARQLRRTLDDRVSRATRRATHTLSKLANRDALTDLGNRRFLDTHLSNLVQASKDADTDLVCVMIDMDRFKQVNDVLGHGKGDELLNLLADLLKSTVREHDLAIRLGGDEFTVFMPGATLQRAAQLTGHIRQLYRQRSRVLLGAEFDTDLSVGVASLQREGARDGEELMEQADQHLYKAKRAGRGRTCSLEGCTAA
ncbi:MAG: diguanylate cyclase [Planctomycetota bacterium]